MSVENLFVMEDSRRRYLNAANGGRQPTRRCYEPGFRVRSVAKARQPKSVSMKARDWVAMGGGAVMSAVILGSGWV